MVIKWCYSECDYRDREVQNEKEKGIIMLFKDKFYVCGDFPIHSKNKKEKKFR